MKCVCVHARVRAAPAVSHSHPQQVREKRAGGDGRQEEAERGTRGQEEAARFGREDAFRCRKVRIEAMGRLHRAAQLAWERSGAKQEGIPCAAYAARHRGPAPRHRGRGQSLTSLSPPPRLGSCRVPATKRATRACYSRLCWTHTVSVDSAHGHAQGLIVTRLLLYNHARSAVQATGAQRARS